jgi:hypothetical protein
MSEGNFLDKLITQTQTAKEQGVEDGFLMPGEIVALTPWEEDELKKKIGWEKGDPVPNMDLIKSAYAKVAFEELEQNALNQGDKTPEVLDFAKLPPKKQQEIKDFVKQAAATHERLLAAEKLTVEGAAPSINDAIMSAATGRVAELDFSGLEDSNPDQGKEPAPQHPEFCPNCRYDITKPDVIGEPTTAEAREFMMAMISGKRFTKEYPFFAGMFKVRFRTLSSHDTDLVIREVEKYFAATNEPITQVAYHRLLVDYRKLLALDSVQVQDNPPIPCTYEGWKANLKENTPSSLEDFKAYVQTKSFPNEPVYRQVMQSAVVFNMFIERLELRITDPNFYKGIE